jgi:hypothetical protein
MFNVIATSADERHQVLNSILVITTTGGNK